MPDFTSYLQTVEKLVGSATKGFLGKLDHMTFKMTINGLKGTDYDAVAIIIDQLVKERKPVSIPPLYVVAKAHPIPQIRAKAEAALKQLDPSGEAEKLAHGKEMPEAVKTLTEHYGNFKTSL
jgi:hypothetical protein